MGVGPYWHFNGVERAAPPMMSPSHWEEWVVPYDGEIMRRIKAADPQARIHVHCHGKVNTLLDSFVSMGVDSTDPVEPPPQGNVDFAAAKKKYKGKLTFFGNIEFLDIETRTPEEMDGIVRRAVLDNGRDNLVLTPSATPHEKPSARCLANCRAYIEAGLKYGTW
jgi:uroporphyrinogen-III decarboxylase